MVKNIIFLLSFFLSLNGYSQFIKDDTVSDAIRDVVDGEADWGDYDGDGDLDLAICGADGALHTLIYRNDNGTFVDIDAALPGVDLGTIRWADFDNDDDLDLLLSGMTSEGTSISRIYRNDDGVFIDHEAGLLGFFNASAEWGDYDDDGDPDIAIIGSIDADGSRDYLKVYKNDEGIFTEATLPKQPNLNNLHGSVSWGDYDNDADLDLLVSGLGTNEANDDLVTAILRNDDGVFVESGISLPGVANGDAKWGDFDNDGNLDIAIQGQQFDGTYFTAILKGDGVNTFTDIGASINVVSLGSIDWGDFDNDGDQDLLISGIDDDTFVQVTSIYKNDNATFSDVGEVLPGAWGVAIWGDYDGDGDLDVLLNGVDEEFNFLSEIYENTYKLFQSITFDAVLDKTYGDADFDLDASASSGLEVSYELISGPAIITGNTLSIAGVGEVIIEASQVGDDNYNAATPIQQSFNVSKAMLSATADDEVITYGDAFPELTVSYDGFVNGEDATALSSEPIITTIATADSDVGIYAITLSGGSADNYVITLLDGTLTIDKAIATITIEDVEQIYDGAPKEATITTHPEGLSYLATYDGEVSSPQEVGSYHLEVTIDEINYQGQVSETFSVVLISGFTPEKDFPTVTIYPVPSSQDIHLKGNIENISRALIYDLHGKLVLETTMTNKQSIDISHILPGTYILNLIDQKDIRKLTRTIIIK